LLTAERHPITVVPGLHRLFLDYCSGGGGGAGVFPRPWDESWREGGIQRFPRTGRSWCGLLAEQNASPSPAAAAALERLATARERW
jgi:hypothetical protein